MSRLNVKINLFWQQISHEVIFSNKKQLRDEFKDLGQSTEHLKIRDEMKEQLLQRITSRKNRVAATDEFVLKDRDYTKEDGIMIGVW